MREFSVFHELLITFQQSLSVLKLICTPIDIVLPFATRSELKFLKAEIKVWFVLTKQIHEEKEVNYKNENIQSMNSHLNATLPALLCFISRRNVKK